MQVMLAGKADAKSIKFPVLASVKLDGIRCVVIGGKLLSRQMKPIPNTFLQKKYGGLPEGTDGELILGDPTAEDCYRKTVSATMSEDGSPDDVDFYVFDNFMSPGGFSQRYRVVEKMNDYCTGVIAVVHHLIEDLEALNQLEAEAVDAGHEGIMIRSLNGPYKNGRSTANEGYLLKLKRFEDAEAVVLDTEELMHNSNAAMISATGHTERSSAKGGMVGRGCLGALVVKGKGGTYDGVEFNIGTGFQGADSKDGERAKLWKIRTKLVGKVVKFKYFPLGSKERPRFPVFLGWRSDID